MCRFDYMDSIPMGTCKMWSLEAGGLYIQVVFREGATVFQGSCSLGD